MKNIQARDGAVIPCHWMLHIQKGGDRFKKVTKITSVIRSVRSSIDGFPRHGIRVSIKFSFDTCNFDNKGTKNTWSKTLILFVAYFKQKHIHKNPKAFKSRSFCFGLLYLSKSI